MKNITQSKPCGYYRAIQYSYSCGCELAPCGVVILDKTGGCVRKPFGKKNPGETKCKGVIVECDYYRNLKR